MKDSCKKDEHLERLWYMKEDGTDSIKEMKEILNAEYDQDIIDELVSEGLVERSDRDTITLSPAGEEWGRQLVRSHRLAERMLYNVLGYEFEVGACEFEHIVTPELVNSICTLLGHPRECPHGLPIPEGECCRQSARTAHSPVVPMTELEVGQSARIAYVNCNNDQRLHKLDGLHIRPGATVKLHQRYPSYVIECEGANIAMDEAIVANICVWSKVSQSPPPAD